MLKENTGSTDTPKVSLLFCCAPWESAPDLVSTKDVVFDAFVKNVKGCCASSDSGVGFCQTMVHGTTKGFFFIELISMVLSLWVASPWGEVESGDHFTSDNEDFQKTQIFTA